MGNVETIGDGRWKKKIACRFREALPAVAMWLQHEAMFPEVAKRLARERADNRRMAGERVVELEVEVYLIITDVYVLPRDPISCPRLFQGRELEL